MEASEITAILGNHLPNSNLKCQPVTFCYTTGADKTRAKWQVSNFIAKPQVDGKWKTGSILLARRVCEGHEEKCWMAGRRARQLGEQAAG